MPLIYLIVLAFVAYALLSRDDAGEEQHPTPPPLPAPTPVPAPTSPSGGKMQKQDGGNAIGRAIAQVGEYMGGALLTQEAKTVWNIAVALGVAVGTINIAVGIIVFVVIAAIAGFIELAAVLSDGNDDQHQRGIDDFEEDWAKAYGQIRATLTNHALAKTAGEPLSASDVQKLDVACAAYADGFMQRTNYYRCTQTMWGIGSTSRSPYAGWMNGSYASHRPPRMTNAALHEAFAFMPQLAGQDSNYLASRSVLEGLFMPPIGQMYMTQSQGRFGTKVFHLASPVPGTYVPDGEWTEPSWNKPASTDPFIVAWGRLGTAHADAAAFKRAQMIVNAGGVRLDYLGSNNAKMYHLRDAGVWMGVLTNDGPHAYGAALGAKRYHWNFPMIGHQSISHAAPIFTEIA